MAIDPRLVSIKKVTDIPTVPLSELQTGQMFGYTGDGDLKKVATNDLLGFIKSGIKGTATQANAPTTYDAVTYPDGLFETYIVRTPLTMPNSWGSAVTQLELDSNYVYFDVKNGVVTKHIQRAKGETGASGKSTEVWTPKIYDANSTVYSSGKIWNNPTATVAGDVPSISPKWIEPVDYALKKDAAITVTNKVINGNFANGTTSWTSLGTLSATSGVLRLTNGASGASVGVTNANLGIPYQQGRRCFISFKFKLNSNLSNKVEVILRSSAGASPSSISAGTSFNAEEWYTYEGIITVGSVATPTDKTNFEIKHAYVDVATATGKILEIKEVIIIDITQDLNSVLTVSDVKEKIPVAWFGGVYIIKTLKEVFEELSGTINANATELGLIDEILIKENSLNLFDNSKAFKGMLNGSGVITTGNTGYYVSPYIPVVAGNTYRTVKSTSRSFYDINKNFISFSNLTTLTAPAGAAFFVFILLEADINTEMFVKGSTLPASYIPYDVTLKINYESVNGLYKKWDGKTWVAIGDSIVSYVKGGTYWPDLAAEKLLVSSVKRTAKPSMRMKDIAEIMTYSGTTEADLIGADLITVSLGQNDRGYALGTIGDAASNSGASFYAATKWLCEYLLNLNPTCTLVFITPTPAVGFEVALRLRAKAIIEVCELYSIPVLDLNKMSGFNSFSFATYLDDTTHPNLLGYKRMANITASFLEQL